MKATILLFLFVWLFFPGVFAQEMAVDEEKYIPLGEIEQWITIKGNDLQKPVILFLHGGPGSVMTPYSEAIYGGWADDFIFVNWHQRGAGRTFGRNLTGETDDVLGRKFSCRRTDGGRRG